MPANDRAKGAFMSFMLGLVVGYWPFRWAMIGGTFLLGFFLGNVFSALKWFMAGSHCL